MPEDLTRAPRSAPRPRRCWASSPTSPSTAAPPSSADFHARGFAAVDLGGVPDAENPGRHMHVQVEINGRALMMTDCRSPWESGPQAPPGFHLQLVVEDGDAWWDRAIAAGCEVVMPLDRMFWGDRFGMYRDPFGFHWAINEPTPE